jgi:hypothetical protein
VYLLLGVPARRAMENLDFEVDVPAGETGEHHVSIRRP